MRGATRRRLLERRPAVPPPQPEFEEAAYLREWQATVVPPNASADTGWHVEFARHLPAGDVVAAGHDQVESVGHCSQACRELRSGSRAACNAFFYCPLQVSGRACAGARARPPAPRTPSNTRLCAAEQQKAHLPGGSMRRPPRTHARRVALQTSPCRRRADAGRVL